MFFSGVPSASVTLSCTLPLSSLLVLLFIVLLCTLHCVLYSLFSNALITSQPVPFFSLWLVQLRLLVSFFCDCFLPISFNDDSECCLKPACNLHQWLMLTLFFLMWYCSEVQMVWENYDRYRQLFASPVGKVLDSWFLGWSSITPHGIYHWSTLVLLLSSSTSWHRSKGSDVLWLRR